MQNSYLIRKATLIQEGHAMHNKVVDVRINKGIIEGIGENLQSADVDIEGENLFLSTGWTDLRSHLTDPGLEHKDTLLSLLDTAAAAGYTSVVTLPDSDPQISDKSGVKYLKNTADQHLVNLMPCGVISPSHNTENLAELFDMYTAGAVAFTNADAYLSNGLLKKALLYTKSFGAKIFSHPSDKSLENGGLVNESSATIHSGLKVSPALAEFVSLREQIAIASYCDAELHLSCISVKESVDLIREAKSQGLKITCDVSIFNLCFTDEKVLEFDENFKLYPPLREEADMLALRKGVADGTIDAICSNHHPQNIESKMVEFDYAEYGALSLQLVLPWYSKYLSQDISADRFIAALTKGPDKILGRETELIAEGVSANLVVWDSKAAWNLDRETNRSMSKNTHEWKNKQSGKVVAVLNNNQINVYK